VIAPGAMVGQTGALTIGIPQGGAGQAVLSVAGARVTTSARSVNGEALASHTRVRVVAVEGGVAIVEPVQ
jgi:membrane protein implicated in regulation of membrane protease activity